MSHVPGPWAFALLALAAFRLYRLAARDTITEPLREAVSYPDETAVTLDGPRRVELAESSRLEVVRREMQTPIRPDLFPKPLRVYAATLVRCHWCLGWWTSLAVWGAWLAWPHAALVAAAPWALSAVVGLASKNLDA